MSQQCMRIFSTAFKESAVLRLGTGERLAEVARELGIARKVLYEWRGGETERVCHVVCRTGGTGGEPRNRGEPAGQDRRTRAQDRPAAGRPRFFSRSLASHRRAGPFVSRDAIYAVIQAMSAQETQGDICIQHLCGLGGVSRAGFYRHGEVSAPERTEADLRDKIQKIALENRFYGYRRVCRDLWRIHGLKVNHKHVRGPMCEDKLLGLRAQP